MARAGRRRQAGAPAPSPSVRRPSGAFPFYLPSLTGPVAALPPFPPSRPLQPLLPGSYRPPRCPRSYGQTHRHLQVGESPRAGGDERADAAPGVGSPFVWGAVALASAPPPPPRRPSSDPAEPSFCSSGLGVGGVAREGRESGLRAGRPDVAGDGLGGVRG